MTDDRVYEVETVERLHSTHRVFAESAEEAESIVRATAWEEGPPHEWEPGAIVEVQSVKEVPREREGSARNA